MDIVVHGHASMSTAISDESWNCGMTSLRHLVASKPLRQVHQIVLLQWLIRLTGQGPAESVDVFRDDVCNDMHCYIFCSVAPHNMPLV